MLLLSVASQKNAAALLAAAVAKEQMVISRRLNSILNDVFLVFLWQA
jgi:hypothetical protein